MPVISQAVHPLLHAAPTLVAQAGGSGGLLDWITNKSAEAKTTMQAAALVIAIGFFIWQTIQSRGSLPRIIMSGLAAGVFIWMVFNITTVQEHVNNEVNSAPALGHHSPAPSSGPADHPA